MSAIVERMEEAQLRSRQSCQPYRVTREYRFYGSDQQQLKSAVTAEVSFVPPNEKTFTIEKAEGSDRGEKIVKNILQTEAEAAKKDAPPINDQNYQITLLGQEELQGRPMWVLRLKPRHEVRDLIDGKAWVDQSTYLIYRIDGELAKSPSWWLKKVHVTMDFGNAGGLWLQTRTRAVADVRLIGKHIFTSDAVNIRTGGEVAQVRAPVLGGNAARPTPPAPANAAAARPASTAVKSRPRRPVPPVLGAGILIHR